MEFTSFNGRFRLVNEIELICTKAVCHIAYPRASVAHMTTRFHSTFVGGTNRSMDGILENPNFMNYKSLLSLQRYARRLNILSEIHRALLMNDTCTVRELYYRNVALFGNQRVVRYYLREVCSVLQTIPRYVGIHASGKGLMAGPIKLLMQNGEVLDCNTSNGIGLSSQITNAVVKLETSAQFILVVEKDTVYQHLLHHIIGFGNNMRVILLTGRGYPDDCTRSFVHRIAMDCSLLIYVLVDCDPFGIEIMYIYKRTMEDPKNNLMSRCFWIGIHPSEMIMMDLRTAPLTSRDLLKLKQLKQNGNISVSINKELGLLETANRKTGLEDLSPQYLLKEYILNKINRQLIL